MTHLFRLLFTLVFLTFFPLIAAAQNVWIQIEARPSLAEAQDRAQAWSGNLENVNGFSLGSGWYGIALGPYQPADADVLLSQLRAARRIPNDSFIADGRNFARQFWPVGGARVPQVVSPAAPQTPVAQPAPVDETPAEARRSESLLDRAAREALQTALQWEGFYDSAIDGAFGRGTRAAMADWQAAKGYEPTGVLTTRQRAEAMTAYNEALESLGLRSIVDVPAGIDITLPMAMLEFERYEPPFAHYGAKRDGGPRALLISQAGDTDMFRGLYDILQTLEIVPLDGPRAMNRTTFSIEGSNAEITTHVYAELSGGSIKGYGLIWPSDDLRRRDLALDAMRASFSARDGVLPDTYGERTEQSIDLLSGLEIRRPAVASTGFFVDDAGRVLTSAATVAECSRITIADDYEMQVTATSGDLALLAPVEAVAPPAIARFQPREPRLQSEISIAGYSYGGRLGAPTLNYGELADLRAPDGTEGILRLSLNTLPGDAGAPVYDATGSVLGMLLAKAETGRRLPEDVSLAADMPSLIEFLSDNGVEATAATDTASIVPEDLIDKASAMTVLVSCWD